MRNQAVATAFSLLLRFVWECVKMASNRIYVNAKVRGWYYGNDNGTTGPINEI